MAHHRNMHIFYREHFFSNTLQLTIFAFFFLNYFIVSLTEISLE